MKLIIILLIITPLLLSDDPQPLNTQNIPSLETQSLLFYQPPTSPYPQFLQKYPMQVVFIALILLALLNYKSGKKTNQQIADKWLKSVQTIILQNFAHVGFGEQSKTSIFLQQSAHQFVFYASGRENLSFFEATFQLRKRQDFFTSYILEFVFPQKDLITIDIPIENNIPLVLAICKKRQTKSIKQKNIDISHLTRNYDLANLNENFKIFAQNVQSLDIIDGYVLKNLNNLQQVVHSIHYTDQKIYSNSPGHLRIVLLANQKENIKHQQAIKLVLYLVDKIASFKLPQAIKTKSQRSRQIFAATKEKQQLQKKREQLQKLKAQKRKQQQLRIKNLPPQKQKRATQNLNKKQLSKRFRGKIMKVM